MNEDLINRLYNIKEKIFRFVNEAESLLNRTILFGALIVFLIWLNLGSIIEFLVAEDGIKENLIEKLEEATDRKVAVEGDVVFYTDPEPIVIIKGIKIENNSAITQTPFLEIGTIRTEPNIMSALIGRIDFNNVVLEDIRMNLDVGEAADDKGAIYNSLDRFFARDSKFRDKKITLKNLQVRTYKHNPLSDSRPIERTYSFPELVLDPSPARSGTAYEVRGSVDSRRLGEVFFFNIDFEQGFGRDSAYSGKLYSTGSEIMFSGKIDTKNSIRFDGKLEGKFSGFTRKALAFLGFSESMLEMVRDNDTSTVKANYSYDGKEFSVTDLKGEGSIAEFTINSKTELNKNSSTVLDVKIERFNYSQMFKSRLELMSEKKAKKVERDFKKKLEEYFLFAVGDDINFQFTLDAPKVDFFHEKTGSLYIKANLNNNQFRINNLIAKLPGESIFNMVGVAEINKEQKQLKGASRITLAGKNMDELRLAMSATAEPEKGSRFGPFYIDAKGFLYGQNIHFREIVARINDDRLAGQMLIDYSDKLKSSAALNFTSLNADKYIPRSPNPELMIGDSQLASRFDFLRVVDSVFDEFDISLMADRMVKSGYNYTDVTLYLKITPGSTEVKDVFFDSELLGVVKGSAKLDLTDFQLKMDVDLQMDRYNMDLLVYGEEIKREPGFQFPGKWNEDKISFEELGSFQGKLNLRIKEFKMYHLLLQNFDLEAHAEESKFVIDRAHANLFGNKIDIVQGVLTTDYPSFSISFSAADLDSEQFMRDTMGLDQVYTEFNMSGVLASTGHSIAQMIQNLKGNLSIVTKNFTVTGVDLAAVGKALPLAKRREYIRLIADELLNKGETNFSFFTGVFAINGGKITFSNLPIQGNTVSDAKVSGVIDLPNWKFAMDSAMSVVTSEGKSFALKGRTEGAIPNISTNWDTSGMTKYWEDRFYSGSR